MDEIFWFENYLGEHFLGENFLGVKIFWVKIFLGEKLFRVKICGENFFG